MYVQVWPQKSFLYQQIKHPDCDTTYRHGFQMIVHSHVALFRTMFWAVKVMYCGTAGGGFASGVCGETHQSRRKCTENTPHFVFLGDTACGKFQEDDPARLREGLRARPRPRRRCQCREQRAPFAVSSGITTAVNTAYGG